jgi:serine phosphatase RsbU (regulator of sigma subunit)
VPLQAGDAFVFYTDGITECGPNRRELLGVDGLMELLQKGSARSAEQLLQDIITGAQNHAGGRFMDDVCMLVGIVTEHQHEV